MNLTETLSQWGFRVIRRLNQRSDADVFLAYSSTFTCRVAIKILFKNTIKYRILKHELNIVHRLQHEHIVKTLGVYENHQVACIVMEYVERDLLSYLKDHGPLSEEKAKRLFLQLTLAVNYLHDTVKIVHRDICCSNILLDNEFNVKLADFSHSLPLENKMCLLTPDDLVKEDLFNMGIILYFTLRSNNSKFNFYQGLGTLSVSVYCMQILKRLLSAASKTFSTKKILHSEWLRFSFTCLA